MNSERRIKIHSVSTADEGSGAERVAWQLFQGMQRAGWESWLLVGDKKTDDPRVLPFYSSPYFDYGPYQSFWCQQRLQLMKRWDACQGHQDFRHPYSHHLLELTGTPPDIVHLHNLHGGYFDLRAAAKVSHQVPTFVTLEDCWWFTGHCVYPLGCERWKTGCGQCPMLRVPPEVKQRDGTRFNWKQKQSIFRQSRFYVAAPSQWILDRARESIFQPAVRESRVIPTGVDLDNFRPARAQPVKEKLGIPPESFVAVYSAVRAKTNPFKDYETVLDALKLLAHRQGPPLVLLAIGEEGPIERIGRLTVRHSGFMKSQRALSETYQAADVLLHAAHQETFGIVTAEGQACGLPVVVTRVGGIPEVVADGETGFLVPPGDSVAMAAAIDRLQQDRDLHHRMSAAARARAEGRFDLRRMIDSYQQWYEEVLEQTAVSRPAA